MAFVTDLIWRSPLGLRINAQDTADVLMTEDWVRIRGDRLAARDGAYDLRITAELWETHFFDLAVARRGRPSRRHRGVRRRALRGAPAAARPRGRRVPCRPSPRCATTAAATCRPWCATATTGTSTSRAAAPTRAITRDHFVELELPDAAPRRGPLWLVAQGWVHPTDSSINVAISPGGTHASHAGWRSRSADASGRFREVRANLGFPAGKDKTVLLDLAGVFRPEGTAARAAVDQPGDLLGSTGLGRRPPGRHGARRAGSPC